MFRGEGAVEKLNKKLYSKEGVKLSRARGFRGLFSAKKSRVGRDWSKDDEEKTTEDSDEESWLEKNLKRKKTKRRSRMPRSIKFFFFASLTFFISAIAVAAFFFYGGVGKVSSGLVELSISGPSTIRAGETVAVSVAVTNNNPAALRSVDLIVNYPEGARSPDGARAALTRYREKLGDILPGESIQKILRSVYFGEIGEEKDIRVSIEYRVEGSNAILAKEETYSLNIDQAPVRISVEALGEAQSRREYSLTLHITSNSDNVLEDLVLAAEYPFGFSFLDANPSPAEAPSFWRLGDLLPLSDREITLRGVLEGEDGSERVFKFVVGLQHDRNATEIDTPIAEFSHSVMIEKPSLALRVSLDGDLSEEYALKAGKRARINIEWTNNLSTAIANVELSAELKGSSVLDRNSVDVSDGFYESSEERVVWDRKTKKELALIEPGGGGFVSFSFASFGANELERAGAAEPKIIINIKAEGERTDKPDVSEVLSGESEKIVKIISTASVSSRARYFVGPFNNNGPIPPVADKETTYTITWSIFNTVNDIEDTVVHATLPTFVRWMNVVTPATENVEFDDIRGEVTWKVGRLKRGVGVRTAPREVSFQVALKPSVSQIGSSPTLVDKTVLGGMDTFAGADVRVETGEVTTRLSTDPQFQQGQDVVLE